MQNAYLEKETYIVSIVDDQVFTEQAKAKFCNAKINNQKEFMFYIIQILRRMNKIPCLQKTEKRLLIGGKIDQTSHPNSVSKELRNLEKQLQNFKFNDQFDDVIYGSKSILYPSSTKSGFKQRIAINSQNSVQKYVALTQKRQVQNIKKLIRKSIDLYCKMFQLNSNQKQRKKLQFLRILSDIQSEGLRTSKHHKAISFFQSSKTCKLSIFRVYNLSHCSQNLELKYKKELQLKKQLHQSRQMIKNLQKKCKLNAKIQTLNKHIVEKEAQLNKIELNLSLQEMHYNKMKVKTDETHQKWILNEGETKQDEKTTIEDENMKHSENIENLKDKFQQIKDAYWNKIQQIKNKHQFTIVSDNLEHISLIRENALQQLDELIKDLPAQLRLNENKLIVPKLTVYANKVIHVYQSAVNKLISANQEKENYISKAQSIISGYLEAEKIKNQKIVLLKQQYLELDSGIRPIIKGYEEQINKGEIEDIKRDIIPNQDDKLINTGKTLIKSMKMVETQKVRSKTVKFGITNSNTNITNAKLAKQKQSLNTSVVTEHYVNFKIKDFQQIRKFVEKAKQIYLASYANAD